jgi:hypothetical protein
MIYNKDQIIKIAKNINNSNELSILIDKYFIPQELETC